MDPGTIAAKYVRSGWFLLDVLAGTYYILTIFLLYTTANCILTITIYVLYYITYYSLWFLLDVLPVRSDQ